MICFTVHADRRGRSLAEHARSAAEYQGLLTQHDDFVPLSKSEVFALESKFGGRFPVVERRFFTGVQDWNERKRRNPSADLSYEGGRRAPRPDPWLHPRARTARAAAGRDPPRHTARLVLARACEERRQARPGALARSRGRTTRYRSGIGRSRGGDDHRERQGDARVGDLRFVVTRRAAGSRRARSLAVRHRARGDGLRDHGRQCDRHHREERRSAPARRALAHHARTRPRPLRRERQGAHEQRHSCTNCMRWACASRWTILASAIRRSTICGVFPSTGSRSTGRSSAMSPAMKMRSPSCGRQRASRRADPS